VAHAGDGRELPHGLAMNECHLRDRIQWVPTGSRPVKYTRRPPTAKGRCVG
jgi:hypothetical protein